MKHLAHVVGLLCTGLALVSPLAAQDRTIRMPRDPQIAPDGKSIAFAWRGDVWISSIEGGNAARITSHPAEDDSPHFSPDGKWIAFRSQRGGSSQIHLVPALGGATKQVTGDSLGKTLYGFMPDGKGLLVGYASDRGFHYSESRRLYSVPLDESQAKTMLFDAGIADAAISPDGQHVLFVRGRSTWWRKGYEGPQAAQLWHADLTANPAALTRLSPDRPDYQNVAAFHPMWGPDSKSYFFVSDPDGTFDVFRGALGTQNTTRVTNLRAKHGSDDGVTFPSVSKDGNSILFRWRFDLQRLDVTTGEIKPLTLQATGDAIASAIERNVESRADTVAFTADGKQMAFVAGGDVWVMDRILKEPVRVTNTPHEESSLAFNEDGDRLFFICDHAGEIDIWEATHEQEDGIWWLAEDFSIRQVTDDPEAESNLTPSPNGKHIAFLKHTDLFVMDADGSDHRRIVEAWSPPSFDWSPDGRWFVYATQDDDYNSDVWIAPLDGTREPFNISRHPDRDGNPVWSGDGKRIAFVGRREGTEADIYYVELTKETAEETDRDRKLEKALAAMKKGKKGKGSGKGDAAKKGDAKPENAAAKKDDAKDGDAKKDESKKEDDENRVTIDFDRIFDRVGRIRIPDSFESGLIWSRDGETLLFSATVSGTRGIYSVEFPDTGRPKKWNGPAVRGARWLENDEIVGLSTSGVPTAVSKAGKAETFEFSVRAQKDWATTRQIAFDQGWRAMRDRFYDPAMNNRDWEAIRRKYRPVAAQCLGADEFSELMNMMLGELNASHMGHRGGSDPLPDVERQNEWAPTTYHLGLRFAQGATETGLRVESVIPGSPCDLARSRVEVGETLLSIDGTPVGPNVDVDRIMTMESARDVEIVVRDREGTERTVTVRPTRSVAGLLYDEWVENNRKMVEELSDGKLGYAHIRGMNMSSFYQLETDLHLAGAGKDGLVIDVRFNGGGSTTDHVLTVLTQPAHAITVSRGSGEGYPQDRKVYASWNKPIVLMCNEHSFSNAEILSHAVKQLGRGRLVGMRTAGGVISTGGVSLLDGSSVRMPMRGWYLVSTGEDMELNGCAPDIAMWNEPGGPDRQLEKAVEVLQEDVAAEAAKGRVRIEPAAAKRLRDAKAREAAGRK